MGRRRISLEGRLHDYDPEVGRLWRSRDDEPDQEVFERLPAWMQIEPKDRDNLIDLQRVIPQVLETMTNREQKLLWCRFWADYTLDETGMVFRVTRERIRQIEAKAIRKLKHPTRSDALRVLMEFCPRKTRLEEQEQKALDKWHEAYQKEMFERHTRDMENRLIEKLLELRASTYKII